MDFQFHLQLPSYYAPDTTLVETLKFCIENNKNNLQQVSQQLRGGMNRNQFQTSNFGKDNFKPLNADDMPVYTFNENESDSGEDFDYG